MLFSEPKIPQSVSVSKGSSSGLSFSALQRAENSSIELEKAEAIQRLTVSVLFSEPKIPQLYISNSLSSQSSAFQCSSASRKFLNFVRLRSRLQGLLFQCSSASRKFLNTVPSGVVSNGRDAGFSALQRAENSSIFAASSSAVTAHRSFSALQRAENSSIAPGFPQSSTTFRFQCSSASRKFLNPSFPSGGYQRNRMFQCSSASRKFLNRNTSTTATKRLTVSVLFSEPKIPQSKTIWRGQIERIGFSALQRAENSSILLPTPEDVLQKSRFSALQRAENSSI